MLELQIANSLEEGGQNATLQHVPGRPLGLLQKATSQLSAQPLPSVSPAVVKPEISLRAPSQLLRCEHVRSQERGGGVLEHTDPLPPEKVLPVMGLTQGHVSVG